MIVIIGKAGTGIFLIKENAKLYKVKSKRKTHEISKRLGQAGAKPEEAKQSSSAQDKRLNLGGGKWASANQTSKDGDTVMHNK